MRRARLAAVAVGVCGLAAGVAAAPGSVAAGPAATGPAGFSVTALADVAVRPGVQHVGRAQASPPTTADCEKSYKIARYSPAQIRQAYHLPAVYVRGYDLASGVGTVNAASFVKELAAAAGH